MEKDKEIKQKHLEKQKEQLEKASLAEQAWEIEKKKRAELRQKEIELSVICDLI